MKKFFIIPCLFLAMFFVSNNVNALETLNVRSGKSIFYYQNYNDAEYDWTNNKNVAPANGATIGYAGVRAVWFYPSGLKQDNIQGVLFKGIDVSFYVSPRDGVRHLAFYHSPEVMCNHIGAQGISAPDISIKVSNCSAYNSGINSVIHYNFDLLVSSSKSFVLGNNFNIYLGDSSSISNGRVLFVSDPGFPPFKNDLPFNIPIKINPIVMSGVEYYYNQSDLQNQTIINQNNQIINNTSNINNSVNNLNNSIHEQRIQDQQQYDRDKQEQQNRENQGNEQSQQAQGMFNFTAFNPFSPIFALFNNGSSCVNIPIISGMIKSKDKKYCPWFPANVRNILTPVLGISSMMLIFGFFIRWLNKGDV